MSLCKVSPVLQPEVQLPRKAPQIHKHQVTQLVLESSNYVVEAVPEILNISKIAGYQASNVHCGNINETICLELAHMVNAELAKDTISRGVVIYGTDTLEETAFFLLQSTVNSTKPTLSSKVL